MANPLRAAQEHASPADSGVILAIDYGTSRLGLALSDASGLTSFPFATWNRTNRRRDLARLRDLVRQHSVRRIVIGLPLHLNGTASEISDEVRRFAVRVEKALGIPVELMDERLSSWEAGQLISAAGTRKAPRRHSIARGVNSRKAPIDDFAAAIILRDYLNHKRQKTGAQD
jgi:putative holliday junction resolvase